MTLTCPTVVYIVIEAHHRAATIEASTLWMLINKVCELHPTLTTALGRPEVFAIARLIVLAWQQRQDYLQQRQEQLEKPWCVNELEHGLKPPSLDRSGSDSAVGDLGSLGFDFDFDSIDWSYWETGRFA